MEMPGLTYSASDYRYGFNSKEKDAAFGLLHYDYGFRIYHPGLGRFLSVDPLAGLAPDWNPYRFGFDNPVLYIDPFGLFESRQEAKDFKKEQGLSGKIRRDGAVFYIQERGKGGGQYAFGSVAGGYGEKKAAVERGIHLRDIGLDGFKDLGNPYSESYNPNAVIQLDWADRAYYFGSMLGFASPSARVITASKVLPGLSKAETGIVNSAKGILDSKSFKAGIEGMKNGINSEITVNGVKVVFQADGPFSGFTLFGENGFAVGQEALQSSDEMVKTVLHETYRISTSAAKSSGNINQTMVTQETNDVMEFVERAFNAINQ